MIRIRDLGTCIRRSKDIVAAGYESEFGDEGGGPKGAGGMRRGEIFACSSRLTETPGKFILRQ